MKLKIGSQVKKAAIDPLLEAAATSAGIQITGPITKDRHNPKGGWADAVDSSGAKGRVAIQCHTTTKGISVCHVTFTVKTYTALYLDRDLKPATEADYLQNR